MSSTLLGANRRARVGANRRARSVPVAEGALLLGPDGDEFPSQAAKAYYLLREDIVCLRLRPGQLLGDAELMRRFGVGRTPVREAIGRLAKEGLVVTVPRRSTTVAEINVRDLPQIFEVRQELESYGASLAAQRATDAELSRLRDLASRLTELGSDFTQEQLIRADVAIHRHLHRATHNRFLVDTLERYHVLSLRVWFALLDRLVGLRATSQNHPAIAEHHELTEAIHARDAQRAADVMRRHVARFQADIRSVL